MWVADSCYLRLRQLGQCCGREKPASGNLEQRLVRRKQGRGEKGILIRDALRSPIARLSTHYSTSKDSESEEEEIIFVKSLN